MPSSDTVSWRVKPVLPVAKLVAAGALTGLAWASGRHDPVRWVLVGTVVLGLIAWALRDLVAPVRLSAGPDGVTVLTGFARRRRLPWTQIQRVGVDRRERRGLRTELLEIDAGESLFLLGVHDLGTAPQDVAGVLASLRSAGAGGAGGAGAA